MCNDTVLYWEWLILLESVDERCTVGDESEMHVLREPTDCLKFSIRLVTMLPRTILFWSGWSSPSRRSQRLNRSQRLPTWSSKSKWKQKRTGPNKPILSDILEVGLKNHSCLDLRKRTKKSLRNANWKPLDWNSSTWYYQIRRLYYKNVEQSITAEALMRIIRWRSIRVKLCAFSA